MKELLPTLGVLYSEFILSLYPILIKTVPTTLFSQYFARFLVFPVLAILMSGAGDFWKAWGSPFAASQSILLGGLNLAHIGCSYYAFAHLLPGVAVSLFYLYPIFNILAGRLFFNEKLSSWVLPIIVVAFIGTVLVAQSATDTYGSHSSHVKSETFKDRSSDNTNWLAITAAIGAALTETAIFVFVKMYPRESPFYAIQSLYPAGLTALGFASLINKNRQPFQLDFSVSNWKWLLGFNALLGFTGYTSRFYSMPRLSSSIFSVLSFVGVLASFLWGVVFLGRKPSTGGLIGGILIASSIFLLRITSD